MKDKFKNFRNKVVEFFTNAKNKVSAFVMANKIVSIIIAVAIVIVIILGIVIACRKPKVGNTSGNLNNSGFSVEMNGWVYYLGLKDSNTDGIYKVKANGDKKEKVSSDYGLYLNKSGNYIYYLDRTTSDYNIVRMKTNGEDKKILVDTVDTEKITVVNNWIYYFKDAKFYKVKTNGKNKQVLSEKVIDNYEIVGKWIYYSYINNGKYIIAKMKTNGEDNTKIDTDAARTFFVKGNTIYYIYENYNEDDLKYYYELYKIKTNGKNKEKITDLEDGINLSSMNFDGNKIFYTKNDENNNLCIYSIELNGKNETKITEIQAYSTIINLHNGWIYYTDINDNGDSQMYRIKINGKDKQELSV